MREAGLADALQRGLFPLSDLSRLPTMNKRDARDNVEQLVWREVPGGVFKYTTGGSSGEPLIFYFGRARQAADAAGRLRARRWWGVEPGEREVYLWGAPVELSKTDRIKTLRDRLVNQLLLNAFEMSPERMDDYLAAIQAWNPKAIYGYASSLALLAAHAESRGSRLKLPALRVVCATGEPLFPHQRELIERVFGAPVSVEYGARDAGLMALQSPDGSLLQMSETHLIEVLDDAGNPVEEGEAVITSLVSEAQPFIRYRTGDVVRRSGRSDPGGRGLDVLDSRGGAADRFHRRRRWPHHACAGGDLCAACDPRRGPVQADPARGRSPGSAGGAGYALERRRTCRPSFGPARPSGGRAEDRPETAGCHCPRSLRKALAMWSAMFPCKGGFGACRDEYYHETCQPVRR